VRCVLWVTLALGAFGCRPEATSPMTARTRDTANLFANGDFELGRPPWYDRRAPTLLDPATHDEYQEFPETISGY
jgi:hypothetical protein